MFIFNTYVMTWFWHKNQIYNDWSKQFEPFFAFCLLATWLIVCHLGGAEMNAEPAPLI